MKVLMINTVPTGRDGITNVIINLCGSMDRTGVSIDLVTINAPDEYYAHIFEQLNITVHVLPSRFGQPAAYMKGLLKLIRSNKFDVVHVHGNSNTIAIELAVAALAGCKGRIAHSHNTTCNAMGLHRLLGPLFALSCNGRLACGQAAGRWLYKNKPFLVINNGIHTERFRFDADARAQIRQRLSVGDDTILLGHVGRFNDMKNQDFLIDMMPELERRAPGRYRMLLIGDGSKLESVRSHAAKVNANKLTIFAGATDRIPQFLSAMDLVVMPSIREGLPLTLVEEQANGLTCIASDTITDEANLTGHVLFYPLEIGAAGWAERILDCTLTDNRAKASADSIKTITQCHYSAESEAEKLLTYYRQFEK